MITERAFNDYVRKLKDTGYCSHYAFLKNTALNIREKELSQGFNKYLTCGYFLIIDLDNGDSTVSSVSKKLKDLNIGHDIYFSGSKGYHITIYHQLICDTRLPYSHKCFVESLGIECDLSIYQAGRIISLPKRIHPKTGKPKKLIKRVKGKDLMLEIKNEVKPNIIDNTLHTSDRDPKNLFIQGLTRVISLTTVEPSQGNRHTQIWSTARMLFNAGLQYTTVLDLLLNVNDNWKNQKTVEEIELAVSQAYKQNG